MQIFHWIFKAAAQHEPSCDDDPRDQQVKQKDIFLFRNRSQSRSDKDTRTSPRKSDFKAVFAILCRKDVAKACFYNTINLKQPTSSNRWDVPRRRASGTTMKKEDIIARGQGMVSHRRSADSLSSSHHVGNKVQPLTEAAATSSITDEMPCMAEMKESVKGEKVKAMSRMKELLRWAAATRADKGGGKFLARKVLLFRNKPALKAVPVPDEDQLSIDSPKISFQWDVESCSTSTSSCVSSRTDRLISSESPSRKVNWITTDSDFVVLEL